MSDRELNVQLWPSHTSAYLAAYFCAMLRMSIRRIAQKYTANFKVAVTLLRIWLAYCCVLPKRSNTQRHPVKRDETSSIRAHYAD